MVLAVVLIGGLHRTARAENPDYRVSLGPFYAKYTQGYGKWYGGHARAWLLDVTGLRRYSGYLDIINLHWRPDQRPEASTSGATDSLYMLARVLRNWTDNFYTFATVGGTVGDAVFPRLQGEVELSYVLPQDPGLVLAFGGGYREYPTLDRPYLVAGVSYALPSAAMMYRFYVGRGIAAKASNTHLLTLFYGERLKRWLRVDFLWGDEAHAIGLTPELFEAEVEAKGVSATLEQWFRPNFGLSLKAELSEGVVSAADTFTFHRIQVEIRPFWTF